MKISAKGRYALAAMIYMAAKYERSEYITVIRISESLDISKIYLEQVFSLLKRSSLLISMKGAQGGYQLARMPEKITVFDILSAIEFALFEKTEDTVSKKAPEIEKAMRSSAFNVLDKKVKETLKKMKLSDLATDAQKHSPNEEFMFYI